MALKIDYQLTPEKLTPALTRVFDLSAGKLLSLEKSWDRSRGTPVFTANGQYASRGWTEWTEGFQYGSALLQYDASGDPRFLELGRSKTMKHMAPHLTHTGVHDHGFNIISTHGNLWRLAREGKFKCSESQRQYDELALKVSGAVQAARWTALPQEGLGYVYSFNGPHSLFIDTIRSMRSLGVAHQLGHRLLGERDQPIDLLERLIIHAETTARYAVYYGEKRDAYDVRGRTAHESIFNLNDGSYRCPNSQQGYSPFTTWTRGLAWAICGFAENLEFIQSLPDASLESVGGRAVVIEKFLKPALAAADFYIANTPVCGVPYWDTGAPNLHKIENCLDRPADPFNAWEPVDSSAAVIAAQGLIRLGNYLAGQKKDKAKIYYQAGLTIARTVFQEPYLSTRSKHQGLLLHSVYHRPNGWDYIAKGQKIPNGESSLWGDYHARELALLLLRQARHESYLCFFKA